MEGREALIAQHVADARKLAKAIHARAASRSMELDEFEQQACLLLLEALHGGAQGFAAPQMERTLIDVLEALAPEEEATPPAEFQSEPEHWAELRSLVDALPGQECFVIEQHYFHCRQLQHIADDMGLTKGRISQIHQLALRRLREGLESMREEALTPSRGRGAFII